MGEGYAPPYVSESVVLKAQQAVCFMKKRAKFSQEGEYMPMNTFETRDYNQKTKFSIEEVEGTKI